MKRIEFLPESYRRRHLQQQARTWEIGVIGMFALVIALSAAFQGFQRARIVSREKAAIAMNQAATSIEQEHQRLSSEVAKLADVAELVTYLEHPWPRTQILNAVSENLPDEVRIVELHLSRQTSTGVPIALAESSEDKRSAAKKDLDQLRAEFDRSESILSLAGETFAASRVYELAQRLGKSPLFASVRIESVGNQRDEQSRKVEFRIRASIKPGHGQQGGSTTSDSVVAQGART